MSQVEVIKTLHSSSSSPSSSVHHHHHHVLSPVEVISTLYSSTSSSSSLVHHHHYHDVSIVEVINTLNFSSSRPSSLVHHHHHYYCYPQKRSSIHCTPRPVPRSVSIVVVIIVVVIIIITVINITDWLCPQERSSILDTLHSSTSSPSPRVHRLPLLSSRRGTAASSGGFNHSPFLPGATSPRQQTPSPPRYNGQLVSAVGWWVGVLVVRHRCQ